MITALIILISVGYIAFRYKKETSLWTRWTPDADVQAFMQKPLPPPLKHTSILDYKLPLRTKGSRIVDATGRRFKLSSVNWYGASDELFIPGGLDIRHRSDIAKTIRKMGFNSVRLPYADELVIKNPRIEDKLLKANRDLQGLRAMDILEAVTNALTDAGLAVIMNNHITSATWCCGADPCDASWANDYLGSFCKVKQTEEDWIRHWEAVMYRHKDNPLVIGADLRNEVRGLWGTMPWTKWAEAAEKCGNRLLKMNPEWLMIVEGTESANDLSGVRERPVEFDVPYKLVYSAHVYAWSGWGSTEGRFKQREYESFAKTMSDNWGYLLEKDAAPVWIGEVGASMFPTVGDATYWQNLWRYLKEKDADFGYWAINPAQTS